MSAKTALQPPPSTMVHDMPSATRQSSLNLLTSNLGTDLFNMLGMAASAPGSAASESTQELDVPSPESYVVCAVIDDGAKTRVRLGTARFCCVLVRWTPLVRFTTVRRCLARVRCTA